MISDASPRLGGSGWSILLGLLLCSPGPVAHAQQDEAPDEAAETYRELVRLALEEFRLHNWPEARVLFRHAHDLAPSARTLRGLGMVSFEMRDYPQAIRELSDALDADTLALTPTQRAEVNELLQRARAFVGRFALEISVEEAQLHIDSAAPELEDDGSVMLNLGPHWVLVEAEGYRPLRREVEVEGGETGTLYFDLQPLPVPTTQPAPVEATHHDSTDTQPALPPPPHAERATRLRRTGWVSLGSAALVGGATLAVWLRGQSKLDDRVDTCRATDAGCSTRTDDLQVHSTITSVGLALTAAAAATGVLTLGLAPRAERPTQLAVVAGGLMLEGEF